MVIRIFRYIFGKCWFLNFLKIAQVTLIPKIRILENGTLHKGLRIAKSSKVPSCEWTIGVIFQLFIHI